MAKRRSSLEALDKLQVSNVVRPNARHLYAAMIQCSKAKRVFRKGTDGSSKNNGKGSTWWTDGNLCDWPVVEFDKLQKSTMGNLGTHQSCFYLGGHGGFDVFSLPRLLWTAETGPAQFHHELRAACFKETVTIYASAVRL